MNKIIERVYKSINFELPLLLAVSGGKDSVVLLDAVNKFADKFSTKSRIVHFNHNLRKESGKDAEFVEKLSDKTNFPIKIIDLDVEGFSKDNNLSIEEAARILRYRKLRLIGEDISRKGIIFTAHTASDQAETVLFRIVKGTGKGGIQGIRKTFNLTSGWKVVRPLLSITTREIYNYIEKKDLKYREDKSNRDTSIPRNYIRHKVIPMLKNINPSFEKNIYKEARIFNQEEKVLERIVNRKIKKVNYIEEEEKKIIELETVLSYNKWLIRRILKRLSPVSLKAENLFSLVRLISKKGALKYIDIGEGWIARKEYDRLIFEKGINRGQNFNYSLKVGEETYIPEVKKTVRVTEFSKDKDDVNLISAGSREYFDADKVSGNYFTVRSRKKGDKFSPWGMNGTKKVKDFCIDEKLTAEERNRLLIVENSGQIIWVSSYRRSNYAPVTEKTERIIKIKVEDER
ncbi:MAG: tRNA lysidine(34) synthetase TilS [Elusimicrobiota bacterium]